jgi:hypothetical protein
MHAILSIFVVALVVGGTALTAVAQRPPAASPAATASLALNGKTVEIRYSAPSVRGRTIFGDGGLLSQDPTYPAWRAGANAATILRTEGDLDIGGLKVPAGTYSLYVWIKDPNAWELIVNRQTGQWGLSYDASRDVGRVKMTMAKPPALVETLKYTLTDRGAGKGELRLEWENHVATVPVAVQ